MSRDGTVRFWETDPEMSLPVLRGHKSYVYPVAYSPDGRWIASGSWDKKVHLWDAATGESCREFAHPNLVRTLAFSPDSAWLVSGCDGEEALSIWDLATGRLRKKIKRVGTPLVAVAVSPDGARIAAQDRQGRLSLLDFTSEQELVSLDGKSPWARTSLAFSPDGRWLAGVGQDLKTIILRDARTLRLSASFVGHTKDVYSVAFNRTGDRLVSASLDEKVIVWDVDTGKCQVELSGHTGEVYTAVFHPDGKRIASAGRDSVLCLWDVATGAEVARLPGHTSYVYSLAFSPDGSTLVSGSGDKTVRLWDTAPLLQRYRARRTAEALRPEAECLVDRLLREKKEPADVASALRADRSLSESLRSVALKALLRRQP
jgi:WD40 repeat protein